MQCEDSYNMNDQTSWAFLSYSIFAMEYAKAPSPISAADRPQVCPDHP